MALSGDTVDKLRGTLGSLGWTDIMKPIIAQFGKTALDALTINPDRRDGDFKGVTDDELRGQFQAYRRILTFFDQEVKVFDQNRVLEEAEKQRANAVGQGSPYGSEENTN